MIKQAFTIAALSLVSASAATAMTLDAAVSEALTTNPEISAGQADTNAIQNRVREAQGEKLPQVTLDAATGWEHSNNSSTRARPAGVTDQDRDLWRNEAALRVRQNIFNGGLTRNNVKQQRARLAASGAALAETRDNLALRAVDAYLNVIRANEQVKLATGYLEIHNDYVQSISARAEAGRGNRADVRQAEGRYALAQANLLAAQRDQQDAEASFRRIIGEQPGQLSEAAAPHGELPADFTTALSIAHGANPAIASAKNNVSASDFAVRAANSMYWPKLDLELNAVRGHNLDGVEGLNNEYSALLRLTKNLYTGGSESANKRALEARRSEAEAELAGTKRQIELDLRTAWHALQTARLRLVPLSQHAVSAEETRDAYRSQFDIGQRTLLDLLDAEIELFNARSELIDEHFTHDLAAYSVLAATGQLANRFGGSVYAAK